MDNREQDLPELSRIEERLRSERSVATGLELDQLKLRAMEQARGNPTHSTKGNLMKSRLALIMMIVLGMMMSTTGATLAITGSSGSGNAAGGQYRADDDDGDVLGDEDQAGEAPSDNRSGEPTSGDSGTDPSAAEQTRTVSDSGEDSLPFTGFLAIPLLIGGVALVGTGAVLRHRARE